MTLKTSELAQKYADLLSIKLKKSFQGIQSGVYILRKSDPVEWPTYTINMDYRNNIIYDDDNNIQYFRDNGTWHKWTYKGGNK